MDEIKKIFYDETNDLINKLEDLLLELEQKGISDEVVDGIFRVMHSIKGGSSMFGFEKLSELTHNLETLYDIIRDNHDFLTTDVFDLTFESVDVLKALLNEPENISADDIEQSKALIAKILQKTSNNSDVETNNTSQQDIEGITTYYINFKPNSDILLNGSNPLFVVDELAELGNSFVVLRSNEMPSIEEINLDLCYLSWEVIVSSKSSKDDVHDVFMFIEDDAEIVIEEIAKHDIFNFSGTKAILEKLSEKAKSIDVEELKNVVQTIDTENKLKQIQNIDSKIQKVKKSKTQSQVNTISNIRVATDKLDELMNMVSELVTTQARLQMFSENNESIELNAISEEITKLTRRLRDNAFSIILIPIESILVKFKRLVRDLSIDLNKDIDFITEGSDTELDKTIIEALNEPLLHLLRNSIDHGIESPETRIKLGKPAQGTIKLKAFYSGSSVHIQISDDGAGLDINKIRAKAIEKGLILPETKLSEKEILDLIFSSGFSTAKELSDVSGRGVGLDIVRKKISDIRGEIDVDTVSGKGTTFTLKLPLTLSIIDGLLVKIENEKYLIPLAVVEKIHEIEHTEFDKSFNDIVNINNIQIPYIYIRDYFNAKSKPNEKEHIIIIGFEDLSIGFVVDDVIGEYQAVLKPLGKLYKKIEVFSGGTILGDGTIAIVLDTNKIVRDYNLANAIV